MPANAQGAVHFGAYLEGVPLALWRILVRGNGVVISKAGQATAKAW